MKLVLKILAGFVGVLVWGALLHLAFNFVNAADDAQMIVGLAMIVILLGIVLYTLTQVGPMIRKYLATLVLLFAVTLSSGCYSVVEPGHAGIKVNNYGTDRGVADYPVKTGIVWYNPFTSAVIEYPTYMQTTTWQGGERIAFNSKEGLSVTADVSLSYQLRAEQVPNFYVKFRADDITNFTHGYLRNVARDAFTEEAAHYTAEELYSSKKEEFLTRVRNRVNAQTDSIGINISQLGLIGTMNLPDNVVQALNAKVKALQDAAAAENNLRTAEANAAIRIAQAQGEAQARVAAAEGEARANRALIPQLTPQAIEWRRLNLQEQAIAKWKGEVPTTMMGGNSIPFITLPTPRN